MFGKRLWPLHGLATTRRAAYGHNDLRRQPPGLRAKSGPRRRPFFVAVPLGGGRVIGYYTLAAGAILFERLPPDAARKRPRHPVPVVLPARLAVDLSAQGHRLGEGAASRRPATLARRVHRARSERARQYRGRILSQ